MNLAKVCGKISKIHNFERSNLICFRITAVCRLGPFLLAAHQGVLRVAVCIVVHA